jgi:hypothetical protein
MRTYDRLDEHGRVISFEIDSIGRSRVLRFVRRAFPDAVVKRQPSENFGEVSLNGRMFIINEAWGDSSRYLIHEQPLQPSMELDAIRSTLAAYRPSLLFSVDGWFPRAVGILMVVLAVILLAVATVSERGWSLPRGQRRPRRRRRSDVRARRRSEEPASCRRSDE